MERGNVNLLCSWGWCAKTLEKASFKRRGERERERETDRERERQRERETESKLLTQQTLFKFDLFALRKTRITQATDC